MLTKIRRRLAAIIAEKAARERPSNRPTLSVSSCDSGCATWRSRSRWAGGSIIEQTELDPRMHYFPLTRPPRRPFPPSQSHTPLSYLALRCAAQISLIPPSSLLPSSDVDLGLFLWPNRDHPPSRSPNEVSALQSCRGTTRRPRTRSTRSGATGTTRGPSSSASTPSPSRSSARSYRRPCPRGRPSRRSGSTSGAGRASRTKVSLQY